MKRRIVIGDVHGYFITLCRLLDLVNPTNDDEIYFVGDLIDRGKGSPEVVELVRTTSNFHSVQGNHEWMMIEAGKKKKEYYCNRTRDQYCYKHPELWDIHLAFMQQLPLYIDLGDYFICHAGLDPAKTFEQQEPDDFRRIRQPFHSINTPYFDDKQVVIGHTITSTFSKVKPGNVASGRGWWDIDTSAYATGWLTGLDLDNQVVYQVNAKSNKWRIVDLVDVVTKIK
jgi:serine/threonine protein phosphatase 1